MRKETSQVVLQSFLLLSVCLCLLHSRTGETQPSETSHNQQPPAQINLGLPLEIPTGYQYQESFSELPAEPQYRDLALSLKDAVLTTLNENFDVQIELLAPKIAATALDTEKGIFDPAFTASVTNTRDSDENVINNQTVTEELKASAGISRKFSYGTRLGLSFETIDRNQPGIDGRYNSGLKVTLSQDLLRNFGVDVNTARIFIAQRELVQSREASLQKLLSIVTEVQKAYWDYYQNNTSLEIRRQSYTLTRELFGKKKSEANYGSLAPVDLVEVESRVATRISEYLEARKLALEADIRLRALLNLPFNFENVPVRIVTTDIPEGFAQRFDVMASFTTALDSHPGLQEILARLQAKEREVLLFHNQTLPNLVASASYGIDRNANDWDESLGMSGAGDSYELGLQLTMPLGNREARSNHARRKLELRSIRTEQKRKTLEIKRDVSNAAIALEQSILLYRARQNDLELKKKNLDAAERKLQYGTTSLRELLDVQTELIEARLSLIEAEVGYEKALVDMYTAQGIIDPALQVDTGALYAK